MVEERPDNLRSMRWISLLSVLMAWRASITQDGSLILSPRSCQHFVHAGMVYQPAPGVGARACRERKAKQPKHTFL